MEQYFKRCSVCGQSWSTREHFLKDAEIELIGYQPDFDELADGTLMFNHVAFGCGTTLELEIGDFEDLVAARRHGRRLDGTEECHGHCLRIRNLERCEAQCDNAWARQVAVEVKARAQRLREEIAMTTSDAV